MARTKQSRRKRNKARPELGLAEIPKRQKDGRKVRSTNTVAARKLEPLPEQAARREALLKGQPGSPDDPLAVARAHGLLTENQCEALHRYRNIAQAYQMASGAPRAAPDVLAAFLPHGGAGLTDEEKLERMEAAYHSARAALKGCNRREDDAVDRMVPEWGRTFTAGMCDLLKRPADMLADHFGFLRQAA